MEYVSLGYYFDRCWPLSALLSVCCDRCGGWVVVCVCGGVPLLPAGCVRGVAAQRESRGDRRLHRRPDTTVHVMSLSIRLE